MKSAPLMTFETWWNDVCQPAMFSRPPSGEASAFIQSVARSAAEKAWEISRVITLEEVDRELRKIELEGRNHAKKQG